MLRPANRALHPDGAVSCAGRPGLLALRLPRCEGPPALLGVPSEPHRIEAVGGLFDEQLVVSDCAEGAQRERLQIGARPQKWWGVALGQRSLIQRRQRVKARRGGRKGVLVLDAREVDWFEAIERVDLAPQQCEPSSRRGQYQVVAFGCHFLGASFVTPCRLLVTVVRRGKGGHEERPGVADTWRRQVRFDGQFGPLGEFEDPIPAAAELFDLEEDGDSVKTMVIRQWFDNCVVLGGEAPGFGESTVGAMTSRNVGPAWQVALYRRP
jgi:hypothetical protein